MYGLTIDFLQLTLSSYACSVSFVELALDFSMIVMLTIRTARLNDLPCIATIQACCYEPEFVENDTAFSSKLQQATSTCWLACVNQQVVAYLISLPVSPATFPVLHATEFCLTPDANMLYLHDLAVHPEYRSSGAGRELIQHAKAQARQLGFKTLCLIAVQDSSSYWQKHGFETINPVVWNVRHKVASFGQDACLMQLVLDA